MGRGSSRVFMVVVVVQVLVIMMFNMDRFALLMQWISLQVTILLTLSLQHLP
jgi:hypothetical protein